MRILMVSAHGNPSVGGAEKHVAELSEHLAHRGHALSFLFAFPGPGPLPDAPTSILHRTDWRDDEYRRLRNRVDDFVSVPGARLTEVVRRYRPDVVHTHNLPGIGTGIWEVCRRERSSVVHTIHDYYLLCPRVTLMRPDGEPCRPHPLLCGLRARQLRRWAGSVAQVVGVSRFVLERHAGIFPDAELHVIRHPLRTEVRQPVVPPREKLGSIGYIGSLDRIKGVHLLLEAAPALAALGCELRVAGRGRMEREVGEAAARGAVRYEGSLDGERKTAFLASCDLGVVPSLWDEPGGPTYTMIEWLSAGRPVLVSRRGGLAEVIDSYPGAIPVDPTVAGIVEAVQRLSDPHRWHDAVNSVRFLDTDGALDRWVDSYERIYRQLG